MEDEKGKYGPEHTGDPQLVPGLAGKSNTCQWELFSSSKGNGINPGCWLFLGLSYSIVLLSLNKTSLCRRLENSSL